MTKDKRIYADRAEYLKKAVALRRKRLRRAALEYKGGQCVICGYSKCLQALEFHHLESEKKDFGISAKGYTRGWKAIRIELDKCVLLCKLPSRNARRHYAASSSNRGRKQGELLEA